MPTTNHMTSDKNNSGPVRIEREERIGLIVLNNPPVNAASTALRAGIIDAVMVLRADPDIDACVIIGATDVFVAGADIREFDAPPAEPHLPEAIAAIEDCEKPIIAAIDGAALGGGFELALGCDARVGTPRAIVGLPEVRLGIIPGSGGTQRLPRLTGVSKAIELITSARHVPAPEALALGMIDAIADRDLRAFAIAYVRDLKSRKRRLGDIAVPLEPAERIDAAVAAAGRQLRGRPIREAVACVRGAATMPFAEGLAHERETFLRLRASENAAAMRHLFFAERAATRFDELRGIKALPFNRVGVVGAGTMGSGIAANILAAGLSVVLVEQNADALAAGLARIKDIEARNVASGRVSADQSQARLAHLTPSADITTLADTDLVIEAVFEDMGVKTALLSELGRIMPPDAMIASNTSYLDLDQLAKASGRPADLVGLHFFAPANVMKLLEIVRGEATSAPVLKTALDFARKLGKVAVVARVGDGFIGNRIYSAYRGQCEFMVEEGALPQEIDAAIEAFGFAMGPLSVSDLSGLDVAWRNRQRLAATRDPSHRYCRIPDLLCEAGRLGRKTGAGWYRYPPGAKKGEPDDAVTEIIAAASDAVGIKRRKFTAGEIQARALGAMVNEAALVLQDGIARQSSDIDLVLVNGYGFPIERGGPMFWASHSPRAEIDAAIDAVAEATGAGFRRADLDAALGSRSGSQ